MAKARLIIQHFADVTVVTFQDTALLREQVIEEAAEALYELTDLKNKRKLILDFSNIRMFASQMLGVLINLNNKSKAIKGALVLCGLRDELKAVFTVTNLDKSFSFFADAPSALTHFEVYLK
jgi:anti-anti-sigma factor